MRGAAQRDVDPMPLLVKDGYRFTGSSLDDLMLVLPRFVPSNRVDNVAVP